jgi:hypothetical protein
MESSTTRATRAIKGGGLHQHAPGSDTSRELQTEQAASASSDYLRHAAAPKWKSDLGFLGALFEIHVFEFAGLEDLAALFTLDELRILVSADDLHAWVLARLLHITVLRRGRL